MEMIMPVGVVLILVYGLYKKVKVFEVFTEGAVEGLHTLYMIIPTITGLIVAVEMLRASGGIDLLCSLAQPAADLLGFPKEVVPMAVLRPVSGSGATALLVDIFERYGTDSAAGKIASVLAGSTDTTVYAVTVYFGSVGITNTRHTLPVGLAADLTAFLMSVLLIGYN